ncbi:MAG TPA: hypothetical protein DDX39_06415 [Bacteroidales bacterium]|nr:MAG: hypothetical protein A2W98_05150 [Bacteroidetes bacterium GWF2_33_38]OFY75423.1 MAG: hypothetical protein A2265_12260 [Bacteroidetes bacterium RIFOXYA12_FULL_33_9]OFY87439.1 MAG: hypothetical protein A2236_04690 [Bacteroidetes bacterium RIFOXYA2_FULL_33_7]HBF88259.1 hypothetical protein [Bacteroidales bacterium]
MKQIVLNIPDSKYNFFLKVIENFNFVKIAEEKEIKSDRKHKNIITDLKQSFHEIELHEKGKIKLKSIDELINEL